MTASNAPRPGLSRRQLIAGTMATALLAACSSPATPAPPTAAPQPAPTTAPPASPAPTAAPSAAAAVPAPSPAVASAASPTAASTFPVSIQHKLGAARIEAAPQRVVTLSIIDLDSVVALGVAPVGTTRDTYNASGISSWMVGKVDPAKTELLAAGNEAPVERIAGLRPDLIVGTAFFGLEPGYANLSQIAPVLGYKELPAGETWQERLQTTGLALGRVQQAQAAIADTEQVIQATRTKYPALNGKTFSLSFYFAPGQIATIYNEKDFAVRYFQALGLRVAPALANLTPFSATNTSGAVSVEQVALLDADLVIMAYATPELKQSLEANPVFGTLKAVQGKRYFAVDSETIAALRFPTALNIPWTLDRLATAFASVPA